MRESDRESATFPFFTIQGARVKRTSCGIVTKERHAFPTNVHKLLLFEFDEAAENMFSQWTMNMAKLYKHPPWKRVFTGFNLPELLYPICKTLHTNLYYDFGEINVKQYVTEMHNQYVVEVVACGCVFVCRKNCVQIMLIRLNVLLWMLLMHETIA